MENSLRKILRNMLRDVQSHLVGKAQWAHGHPEIEHHFINRFNTVPFAKYLDRFDHVRQQNAINQKAGTVLNENRQFANSLNEANCSFHGNWTCLLATNYFDQLHSMNRIEKVD